MKWLLALLCAAGAAHAQENSTLKMNDVIEKNSPAEDIDEMITNSALRAESGSKSRWSIASTLNYNGSTISRPFAEDRPNITKSTGTITKSVLDGQISGKLNMAMKHSVMAGVGIRWIAPLESRPHDYDGDRFDADNPYVIYQYLYNLWGLQSVLQIQPTYFTNVNLVKEGYVYNVNVNQDTMYEIGKSGVSVGASVYLQYAHFNKSGPLGQPEDDSYMPDVRVDQADYSFGVEPAFEYEFREGLSLRTLFGLWNYEHIRNEPRAMTYHLDTIYQSVGLGLTVTRDIYLYPNVQFLPEHLASGRTNVALNANINLF